VKRYIAKAVKGWAKPGRERWALRIYRRLPARQKARAGSAALRHWRERLDLSERITRWLEQ
jgi:hypothetical protein